MVQWGGKRPTDENGAKAAKSEKKTEIAKRRAEVRIGPSGSTPKDLGVLNKAFSKGCVQKSRSEE